MQIAIDELSEKNPAADRRALEPMERPPTTTSRWRDGLLQLLLVTDAFLIGLHLLHLYSGSFRDKYFSIEQNRGLGESFQYVKLFWMAVALTALATRRRSWLYLGWAALSAWMLTDDSFEVHENVGRWLGERWALPAVMGLRGSDLGELLFWGAVGFLLLAWIGLAHRRSPVAARSASRTLFFLLIALVFVGAGVDVVHVIVERLLDSSALNAVLGVVEDGGEMVVVSFMTWFVLRLASSDGVEPPLP